MKPKVFLSVRIYIHSPLKLILQEKIKKRRNPSVKESRKGLGGSSGKTLKRNLYPLNCAGLIPKITMERV
jgi:hypothetical protein